MAATVAAAFTVFGLGWVLFTDSLLYAVTHDPTLVARFETAKGWIFVGLTSLVLYLIALRGGLQLARAQATVSAVIESIADGVLLLGPDRNIVHANPAAVKMLGCRSLDELLGMDAPEFSRRFRVAYPGGALVPPDQYASQRAFDTGGPRSYKALLHPGGDLELVILVTAAPVAPLPDQPVDLVVSVMHDVTHAERLSRMRDRFIAAAAHQFKTPVAIAKANAQTLASRIPTEFARAAEAISRECDRMDRRLQNLLVLARTGSDRLELFTSDVALEPLVSGVAQDMAKAAPRNPVQTECTASPHVYADAERLALALRDLIEEAIRIARPNTGLTVLLKEQGHDALIGCCFQPLPREERSLDEYGEYDDIGINRSVAQLIVNAHGGAFEQTASSDQHTAWIRLPAIAPAQAPA